MKRPLWLATGTALGVAGTLWVEQRVRRRLRRAAAILSPSIEASRAVDSLRGAQDRARAAIEAGRSERRRREAELRSLLDATGGHEDMPARRRIPPSSGPTARRSRAPAGVPRRGVTGGAHRERR